MFRKFLIGTSVSAAGVLILSSCAGQTVEPISISATAASTAVAYNSPSEGISGPGDACFYPADFGAPKISDGETVTLRDSAGEVIGLSELGVGGFLKGWEEDGLPYAGENFVLDVCVYPFEFADIVSESEFFSIQVGSNEEVQVTREALLDPNLSLTF